VLDGVMLPPADEPEPLPSIVEIAVNNPDFETLVVALTAADLVDTLSGPGPFTVFAPTDDAFALLPEGTIEALLADIPTLTDILTYHVIAGEVPAADVVATTTFEMLNGLEADVNLIDGAVYIDGARISVTNIQASNGIIHVLDAVMLPPGASPAPAQAGTCADPIPLPYGQRVTVRDDSARGVAAQRGACGGGGAPELVYELTVPERALIDVQTTGYDTVLYGRAVCEDTATQISCNNDSAPPGAPGSRLFRLLDAGTYYVFVDGRSGANGEFKLTLTAP
jgi:uncharacterized surface protein with fasciclin (FAS1) repeats